MIAGAAHSRRRGCALRPHSPCKHACWAHNPTPGAPTNAMLCAASPAVRVRRYGGLSAEHAKTRGCLLTRPPAVNGWSMGWSEESMGWSEGHGDRTWCCSPAAGPVLIRGAVCTTQALSVLAALAVAGRRQQGACVPHREAWSASKAFSACSQGCRSSSLRACPARIFCTLHAGWKSSAS